MDNLAARLERLLNEYSAENGSNTPDFILATFLLQVLAAFNEATNRREKFYGRPTPDVDPDPRRTELAMFAGYLTHHVPALANEMPRLAELVDKFVDEGV